MILKYDFKLAETRAKSGGYTFRDAWDSVKVNIAFVCFFFVSLFELTVFFYNSNDRNNKSDVFVVRYFFA